MAESRHSFRREGRPRILVDIAGEQQAIGILEMAGELGWDLLNLSLTFSSLPNDIPPSGALLTRLPTDRVVKALRQMKCPIVRLGSLPHPQDSKVPAVLPDQHAAGRMAADHFAELGFRQVAHIGSDPWSKNRALHEGFIERAAELGLERFLYRIGNRSFDSSPEGQASKFETLAPEIGAWLACLPKPLAVLAPNDHRAAQLIVIAHRQGLSVPEEVAFLGYGNGSTVCEMSPVPLSSIDPARDDIGRRAAYLLKQLMDGGDAPRVPVFVSPAGVVRRRSTEVLPVSDSRVARAIRFLWDNFDQNISVDDVAAESGMPRRSLERVFRQQVGRGVNAELRRKRLEYCCRLLVTTDLSVTDIAAQSGFGSADYLHAAFRRSYGTTPRKWRLRHAPDS